MYFLALSQAPPVFAAEIAIWTPDTKAPGKNPATALGPNATPITKGENMTKQQSKSFRNNSWSISK